MATERSLHSSHSPQRNAQASTVRTLPIYEALLQKGRLMQEHRERLQQEAIEREMREVRPAPRVAGQRIEDRLLQRAKEKHELEEKAGQVRAEREAEDLAVIAPFHPHISAHALATKSRYKEPPPDRAAWRARRLAELAQMCQSSGAEVLEELQDVPSINPRSAKLAALRKAREGLDGVPVPDALLISEHRRRLAQWQAAEAEREARSHAVPSITRHAARMRRVGSVGDRLHAESYEVALRRLQREVAWREAHTPFQPLVTPLGAVTAPRYQREGDTVAHTRTLEGSRILSRQNWVPRDSFQPSINPVSAAIAQRLPETAMERLCRPSAVHSLSSYVDPTSFTDASGVSPSPSIAARSQTRSCLLRTPSAHQQHGAVLNTPSSTLGALPSSVVASLDAYERRRQRRLEALRKEQVEHEQRECTFQPQINAHSSSLTGAFASASGQRGPSAVARRSGEWQQQRERHLETMRQWQAERAAAEQTMATRVRSGARTAAPSSSPLSYSIYGGDGTPWGVEEYLARQQLARAMRQRAQEALERQSVSVDGRDRPSSSSAPPPVSKQMGLDHRVRSSSMLSRRPSPIRSLRPAVPASQEVAIAHMFASAEEASSDGGWRCWKGGEHVMRAAAASLLVDDDAPYHDSRPIARLPLDDDGTAVLPLPQAVQYATESDSVSLLLSSDAEEKPSNETGKEATWMELRKSSHSTQPANHSGTHTSYHDSHHGTRRSSASRADGGSPHDPRTPLTHCTSSVDKRHIERLARPRGAQGSVIRPAEPNYGRLLNFTEEEEQEKGRAQQHCRKSPRTRPSPITPSLEQTQPTGSRPPPSRPESNHHTAVANVALPASQKACYEKLAAPKKCPAASAVDGGAPPSRTSSTADGGTPASLTSSTAAAPRRDSSKTFDRLAVPKKPVAARCEEAVPLLERRLRSHSLYARVLTPPQHDLYLQCLSRPKNRSASSHRDPCAPVEPNLHIPQKRYYGGTTVISVSPGTPTSTGLPLPSPHAGGRRNSRVPSASWEAVASYAERRPSSKASCFLPPSSCAECGTALPQQTYTVPSQPTLSSAAALHEVMVEQVGVIPHQPLPAAPAANGDGLMQVQSAPAKITGSKPPIVVRTRRYVPPSEEQDAEAAGQSASRAAKQESPAAPAPEPVEAVRRRTAIPTVPTETTTTPALEKEKPKMADTTPPETPARAMPAPVAVQAIKRAPPLLPSVPTYHVGDLQKTDPCSMLGTSSTRTLAPGSSTSASAVSALPSDKVATATPQAVAVAENGTVDAASASAMEDVHAIPTPPSSDKKKLRKITHRKPNSAKPEVLRDADFACQLEVLPGTRHAVSIKKPYTLAKPTVKALSPKSRWAH
ncbi:hypothetical protein CGC20_24845 [Leishmania donovani]|uniref:Uncharacterized protein n=1 Tax=Leishmania donovani TaxID=5661 RepID=A0A504XPE9_LEIDO|nr:hypothetical protein CGC20_24845 [Leishmania donovani]